ncbi:alpha-amylase family protein [Shewanella sp. JM162201]|uniref:Alpha-amylase family protein n=2 Tax=Shewanella jiangmenensis TaxID=2837387 RepID=A0ABS5V850_9GAMM|nr:alpha-amylase family protein [Shewanella jiangmenensis]
MNTAASATKHSKEHSEVLIYQMLPRVFGNQNPNNVPWGSLDTNGTGKFADISDAVLADIRAMGVSHVWYTGVLHHASMTDYSAFGIEKDDADVVKGIAGSPYAIRDYYNVNPDLALSVPDRLDEFRALVARSHKAGLKVIIDIVPNHVARRYHSPSRPLGMADRHIADLSAADLKVADFEAADYEVADFGAGDDTSVSFAPDNNFYYVPGKAFEVPASEGSQGMPSAIVSLQDGKFAELPAKWTGNGDNKGEPHAPKADDWYETVKLNYGVAPDGSEHFPKLPVSLAFKPISDHQAFWATQARVPDTWVKMRDISRFWLSMGVDGFRFDMAEMVPVPFWSYLVSDIKAKRPDALLIAEVYDPKRYRDFIGLGKLDLLYDKVGLYDTLKAVSQGKASAGEISQRINEIADIKPHMLHFLENHDEQRIASPEFLGDGAKALPALAVSLFATDGPFMLYFGQRFGEDGSETGGFGKPSRTSIFDYVSAPAMARYLKQDANGNFGAASLPQERALNSAYLKLLALYPGIKAEPLGRIENGGCEAAVVNEAKQNQDMQRDSKQHCAALRIYRGKYLIEANFSDSPLAVIDSAPADTQATFDAHQAASSGKNAALADKQAGVIKSKLLLSLPELPQQAAEQASHQQHSLPAWGVRIYELKE